VDSGFVKGLYLTFSLHTRSCFLARKFLTSSLLVIWTRPTHLNMPLEPLLYTKPGTILWLPHLFDVEDSYHWRTGEFDHGVEVVSRIGEPLKEIRNDSFDHPIVLLDYPNSYNRRVHFLIVSLSFVVLWCCPADNKSSPSSPLSAAEVSRCASTMPGSGVDTCQSGRHVPIP